MRSTVLLSIVACVAAGVGCGPSYLVTRQPTESLAPYGGAWDVLQPEVSDHVFSYYPGKEGEWKAKVDIEMANLVTLVRDRLSRYRPTGDPMTVRLKVHELRPGGFWANGSYTVEAVFTHPDTGEDVAACQVTVTTGQMGNYNTWRIADVIARFVIDYSR